MSDEGGQIHGWHRPRDLLPGGNSLLQIVNSERGHPGVGKNKNPQNQKKKKKTKPTTQTTKKKKKKTKKNTTHTPNPQTESEGGFGLVGWEDGSPKVKSQKQVEQKTRDV